MESRKSIFKLTRSQWISVAVLASSLGLAIAVSIPNSFTAGTTISASQMNANFTALGTAVTAAEGAITAANTQITSTATALTAAQAQITAVETRLNAPGRVSVSGVAFIQKTDNDTSPSLGCNANRGNFYFFYLGGNNCDAFAPIQFPNGATLTGLNCLVFDNSAIVGAAIVMTLSRIDLATGTLSFVFQTSFSGDSAAVQVLTDTTVTAGQGVVDNNAFAYLLWADFGTADLSAVLTNLRLYGCSVSYTPA